MASDMHQSEHLANIPIGTTYNTSNKDVISKRSIYRHRRIQTNELDS